MIKQFPFTISIEIVEKPEVAKRPSVKVEPGKRDKNILSARQLQFKRDDTATLIRKAKDVRFTTHRKEILVLLKKRYLNADSKPTTRNAHTKELIDKFREELKKSSNQKRVAK